MRVPLSWLGEWVDLPPLPELEERLTVGGLEIEQVIRTGPDLAGLRVGQVRARRAHPDADRLSVCEVDAGEDEPLEIVCGAPNVAAGQKVALALPGSALPDGTRIRRAKIRGVTSHGMICSGRELGLSEDAAGILVLPEDAPVGAPLCQVVAAGETVLDVEITPNRGDWVSMLGMAREVRAHFGGALRWPPLEPAEDARKAADDVAVAIEDASGCRRYVARVVRGVRIGPSPAWLAQRLEAAGLRPRNNVVDVTNLVMLELGQPLHAFDLARVRGGRVIVRAAAAGEKIRTLDGQLRELSAEDLVIADAEGAIAVAGVMGGAESEVQEHTRDVLLESADFDARRVRATARRLGLHSDASYRFERGVDPEGQGRAADRAARLLAELAGGTVSRGIVEARGAAPPALAPVSLSVARTNRLLGTNLSSEEMAALLERVEVAVEGAGQDSLRCTPPSHRLDLRIPADLAEEVARLHGYDRIASLLPAGPRSPVREPAERRLAQALRSGLAGAGLVELMTFPGAPEGDPDGLGLEARDPRRRLVRVRNPIQAADATLRSSLVPSLLRAARTNLARQSERLRLFEVSRVFRAAESGTEALPEERLEAAALWLDGGEPGLWEPRGVPLFFQAKGVAERVLAELWQPAAFRAGSEEPYLHPGACGELHREGRRVAFVGELHPDVAARFEIDRPCALAVLDGAALLEMAPAPPRYREVSRHPRVRRDLAVLLGADVAAGEALEAIREAAGGALQSVEIFDRYTGRGVPEGRVSLAFRLVFQRLDRTLTDAEVAKATERVVHVLETRFGGELRSGGP